MLGKMTGNPFRGGEVTQGGRRLAEESAMLECPRGEKCLAITLQAKRTATFARYHPKAFARVEFIDAIERREFEASAAAVAVKIQRTRTDHGVFGHGFGRFEVTLDARILDELHIAKIREALSPTESPEASMLVLMSMPVRSRMA